MTYTVTFTAAATDQLGELWFIAGRSRALTDAAAEAERGLRTVPVDSQTRAVEDLFIRALGRWW